MAKTKTGDVKFVYVPNDIAPNFPQNYTVDENTIYFVEYSDGDANLNKIYVGGNQYADASVRLDNVSALVQTIIDDPQNEYSVRTVGSGDYVKNIDIDGKEIVVTLGEGEVISIGFPEVSSTIDLSIGSESSSNVTTNLSIGDNVITPINSKIRIRKPEFGINESTKSLILNFGDGVSSEISLAGIVTDQDAIDSAVADVKSWANDRFPTKDYVQTNYVSNNTLDSLLREYATTDFVQENYLSKDNAQDTYVQKTDLNERLLTNYFTKTDIISNYYTKYEVYNKAEVDSKIADASEGIDLSGYQRVIDKLGFAEYSQDGPTAPTEDEYNGQAFIITDGSSTKQIKTNLKIASDIEVNEMLQDIFD